VCCITILELVLFLVNTCMLYHDTRVGVILFGVFLGDILSEYLYVVSQD